MVRAETRCAACTEVTPAARFCRHCAAELVADAWYGAARMLIEAGVDRLALAARVAALDPEQRAAFASRFARQRALVEQVVAIARACEARLVTSGHADSVEEALVKRLPQPEAVLAGWAEAAGIVAAGFDGHAWLEVVRTGPVAAEVGGLVAIAQLRAGDRRSLVLGHVQMLAQGQGPLALDAVVALQRAALDGGYRAVERREVTRHLALADGASDRGLGAARSARVTRPIEVSLTRALLRERTALREALPAALAEAGLVEELTVGLAADDVIVRYGCAWLLADEAALAALLAEPRVDGLARRALAALDSPRLVAYFDRLTDDAARRAVLSAWPSALGVAAFASVVASLDGAAADYREHVLARLTSTPFDQVAPEVRAGLARQLAVRPPSLDRALDLVRWAVGTDDHARPYRSHAEVAGFAEVAARLLAELPDARATVERHGTGHLLAVATEGAPFALVQRWLGHADSAPYALRAIFSLQSQLASYADPPDRRGIDLLIGQWSALGPVGQAALAPVLGEVSRRETGSAARDELVAAWWQRFLDHPDERAAVWRATEAYREQLEQRRDGDPRALEFDGGDPARRFALYSALDLAAAPPLLGQLLERFDRHPAMTTLTPVVVERATSLLEAGRHRHGLWLFASWCSEVVNRFRSDDTREAWRATALALAGAASQLATARARTTPEDPGDRLDGFDEQIATELRLAGEVVEREDSDRARAAERARREQERAAEAVRRAQERQRQDQEREVEQRRQDEQRQRDARARTAEAAARLAHAQAAIASTAAATSGLGVEHELLLPGQPLPTLAAYAGLLRAMQTGADVMALFELHGLTPTSWAACASAWTTVIVGRPELGLRFAALLR